MDPTYYIRWNTTIYTTQNYFKIFFIHFRDNARKIEIIITRSGNLKGNVTYAIWMKFSEKNKNRYIQSIYYVIGIF